MAAVMAIVKDIEKNDPAFEEKAKPAGVRLLVIDPMGKVAQTLELQAVIESI